MTYYIAQEKNKRSGILGPFWTGEGWSTLKNAKLYQDLDSATEGFAAATRAAVHSTLLMDGKGNVVAKNKIRQGV
jgi:hypothetical protein